jgi:hypothetical protein
MSTDALILRVVRTPGAYQRTRWLNTDLRTLQNEIYCLPGLASLCYPNNIKRATQSQRGIFMSIKIAVFLVASVAIAGVAVAQTESTLMAEVQVCTSVVDRVPQGTDTTFSITVGSVYCWSKITGAAVGETSVTHVWMHEGVEMARVELPVRSASWRTHSQKNLYGKSGNWEVQVLDSTGKMLASTKFKIVE